MPVTPLSLTSECYGGTGNIGDNSRRLLGAPSLDRLQTVIREAVQNVADAARAGSGPEIEIRVRKLTLQQRQTLERQVFRELPQEQDARQLISRFANDSNAAVLEICDFRTVGLRGPTRPDRIPLDTEHTDFIDFLRNIGTARNTGQGGGTYGFGKVALYEASRCGTIIVDTLPHGAGRRRLIACHVGASFEVPQDGLSRRYTGRHWWGYPDPVDGIVDPVTGADADELAGSLGLPERDTARTGTSIMILDFDNEGEDLSTIGGRIVETLLWNFWPRMMRDTPPDRRFTCRVEVDGRVLNVPAPEDIAPLDLFAKAMRAARSGQGNDVRPIASQRPARHLGTLAVEKAQRTPRQPLVEDDSLFPTTVRHVALMRPVELVVRYLEGAALPDERLQWAGVFIASSEDEVERAFADSEPPAHDDWIPDHLPKGSAKTFVRVALRDIKAIAMDMGALQQGLGNTSVAGPPLAKVAGRLGAALEGVGGDGARRGGGAGGGGGARPLRARASRPLFVRLERAAAQTVAVFATEVKQDSGRTGKVLVAEASVAIEGSAAGRLDDATMQPSVTSIRAVEGEQSGTSNRLEIDGAEGTYELRVVVPPECAVTLDVDLLSGDVS